MRTLIRYHVTSSSSRIQVLSPKANEEDYEFFIWNKNIFGDINWFLGNMGLPMLTDEELTYYSLIWG